jgi:hypothetical protein
LAGSNSESGCPTVAGTQLGCLRTISYRKGHGSDEHYVETAGGSCNSYLSRFRQNGRRRSDGYVGRFLKVSMSWRMEGHPTSQIAKHKLRPQHLSGLATVGVKVSARSVVCRAPSRRGLPRALQPRQLCSGGSQRATRQFINQSRIIMVAKEFWPCAKT